MNDVRIRIFTAQDAGGIPIVLNSLRLLSPVREIPDDDIVFCGPDDVVKPSRVAAAAAAEFNNGGRNGVIARHRMRLELHHGDRWVMQILPFLM